MSSSILAILLMVLGGAAGPHGVSELLDAADPRSYLEAKGIEYNADALIKIVEARRTKKLAEEKAQEISKLLAMRALGELGDKAALPCLTAAAASKHAFYGDYAKAAIAEIEGTDYTRPATDADAMQRDLALMPAGLAIVTQVRFKPGRPAPVVALIDRLAKRSPAVKPNEILPQINQQIGLVAEKIGNVRLEGVTLGMLADYEFFQGVFRGRYDSKAVEAWLAEMPDVEHREVDGTLFAIVSGGDVAFAPVSDELFIAVGSDNGVAAQIEELASKLKAPPKSPDFRPGLAAAVKKADISRLWGAMTVNDVFLKEVSELASIDDIIMKSELIGGRKKLRLTLIAEGKEPKAVKQSMDWVAAEFGNLIGEIEKEVAREPQLKPALDFLRTLQFKAAGNTGTLTIEIDAKSIFAAAQLTLLDDF